MLKKFFPMQFSAQIIELAQQRLVVAKAEQKIVDDITLFIFAMQEIGYTTSVRPSGCLLMSECQNCRSSCSIRFEKKRHYYFACPHCQTITVGFFMAGIWNQREENRLITSKDEVFWHSEGRTVYDRKYRQSYIVSERGDLMQDDIIDYELGRIDLGQLDNAECRRLAWINSVE